MHSRSSNNRHIENISREHFELHEGNMFSTTLNNASLSSGNSIIIAFKTPAQAEENKGDRVHLMPFYSATGAALFEMLEGPEITLDTGSESNVYNRFRSNPNESGVLTIETTPQANKVTTGPTITDDGEIVFPELIGQGNNKQGGASRDTGEWILEPDTIYAFRLTSASALNVVNLILIWYECDVAQNEIIQE